MIYLQLFLSFLQIGMFSFGGGYAAMPFIQDQVVNLHHWLSLSEFTDLITISQMTPGPIAVNSATFVGLKIAGFLGAVVATLGCILPSCLIVSILAYIYQKYHKLTMLQTILSSLRPAVVAMIASAGVSILVSCFWPNGFSFSLSDIRFSSIFIFIIAFVLLHYKKATIFVMLFAVLFTFGSAAVFATGGQAPFPSYLSAYCASSNCRWGVKATLSRDIALGENPQMRADNAILSVLREDTTGDPDILKREIKAALAAEFGVERRAFTLDISLCLDQKTLEKEYAAWGITPQEDGTWLYQGESVRTYEDKMLGSYQSREKGAADISVQRNRLGEITEVTVWRQGDPQYDRRGERIEQGRFSNLPAAEY